MLWQAVSIIGIIAALVLLSYLVMRGVNLLVVAVACSLLVAITGHIDLYDALAINYMSGFASFVQNNFLIFLAGALMGTVYEITQGAKSIARLIIRTLGKKQATLAVILSVGILTYGGIAGFVVCFAVFPIALEVYRAYSVRDLGRVDLIWDGGAARCFEVDVSPGMTERSLFPMACAAAGLSLPAVLDTLVNEAYARGACF